MKTTKLRIDGQFFHIDPAQDTDVLRREVLAGSTAPAYVHFAAIGHGEVSVLMSPGMSARFEVREILDEQLQDFENNPPLVDYDAYSLD